MNKKDLSERYICTKFITLALESVGWDMIKSSIESKSQERQML